MRNNMSVIKRIKEEYSAGSTSKYTPSEKDNMYLRWQELCKELIKEPVDKS